MTDPLSGPARASSEITQLLLASRRGDSRAEAELMAFVYDDLRRLAARQLSGESPDFTLSATALVNEAYLRLVGDGTVNVNDRSHFFRLAGRTMRRIAVDHARARLAEKRGGGERPLALEEALVPDDDRAQAILEVSDLLDALGKDDARLVAVVECRFYMGLTEAETASMLGVSRPTVSRDWERARARLREMLAE